MADGRTGVHGSAARSAPLTAGLRAMLPAVGSVILFSFFINLLMFVSPLYMLQIYDRVLSSRSEGTLISITIIASALLLTYGLLEMVRARILVRAGILFDEKMARATFEAIHRAILRRPDVGLVQGLRDVDTLREFATGPGLIAFCDVPWFPVFVLGAFLLHPLYGWIAIVGGLVIWGLTLTNEFLTRRALSEASAVSRRAAEHANAAFRNVEVLQAMGMLGALRTTWSGMHLRHLGWQARASDQAGALISATKSFRLLLQTIVLGTGGYLCIRSEISAGAIIAGSILIGRALQPMEMAVGNWKAFVAARLAYKRLTALFDLAGATPLRMALPRPIGALTAERVFAGAPGRQDFILRGVSFVMPAGEILCIVGPSGAGKTTLSRLLVGVWPLSGGSLRLDGYDISQWDSQELGRHIGYLPQDVELFSGSIAQNIGRFREAIEPAQVIAAAGLAGCHEMIQLLSEGYDTEIGDGGRALSGGQRQRIALARALYDNPSLIVLDEPNSNLDAVGEEALINALQELKKHGATVVLITHKINILTISDRILVMAGGSVQAYGPRDEILGQLAGPRVVSPQNHAAAPGVEARHPAGAVA